MWRSLWKPYAQILSRSIWTTPDNKDVELCGRPFAARVISGSPATPTRSPASSIATSRYDDLRDDALFAYALAMPGETTRGRVKRHAAQDRFASRT